MSVQDGLPPDREVFRLLYESDDSGWGKGSGPGSTPFYNIEYRAFLEKFIGMNHVRSVVDIGCGDWQFSKFVNFDYIDYLGLDVVPSVVARNTISYGTRRATFSIMPENIEEIPNADLLIMKDVLQHLPNSAVFDFAKRVFPKFRFCLLTNSYAKLDTPTNCDIEFGQFRCIDLASAPFSLKGSYVLEFPGAVWERLRTFLHEAAPL